MVVLHSWKIWCLCTGTACYTSSALLNSRARYLNFIHFLHVHLCSVCPRGSHPIPPKQKETKNKNHAQKGNTKRLQTPRRGEDRETWWDVGPVLFFLVKKWFCMPREEINCRGEAADGSGEMLQSWVLTVFCCFYFLHGFRHFLHV